MSCADPHWSEPKRVRASVRHKDQHIGYLTTLGYPHRDLTPFPEGSPYSEFVISDLADHHVALLQRFKQHWLVQCGEEYASTAAGGELTPEQILKLAVFSLEHVSTAADILVAVLKAGVEKMLAETEEAKKTPPAAPASRSPGVRARHPAGRPSRQRFDVEDEE